MTVKLKPCCRIVLTVAVRQIKSCDIQPVPRDHRAIEVRMFAYSRRIGALKVNTFKRFVRSFYLSHERQLTITSKLEFDSALQARQGIHSLLSMIARSFAVGISA